MAAHKWSLGACGGCPRGDNGMGIGGLKPHVERMSVCVRGLHSKLPLKL